MDVALIEHQGEPRALDIDIAERLGFSQPRDIRKLIKRHAAELAGFGAPRWRANKVRSGKGRWQNVEEFLLNEEQALLVSVLSDAPHASDVRAMLIRVFVAWRRGHLAPTQPSDLDVRTNGIARQVNGKVTALERMVVALTAVVTDVALTLDGPRRLSAVPACRACPRFRSARPSAEARSRCMA